jgi:hypothetical protein
MQDITKNEFHELKAGFPKWKDTLLEEIDSRMTRVVSIELQRKEKVTVLCPESRGLIKKEFLTTPIGEPIGSVSGVTMFVGNLREGDVVDVGEGGTIWDHDVRWGVVTKLGDVLYLEGGNEEDVMGALKSAAFLIKNPEEQDKLKEQQYLQHDPQFEELYRMIFGYEPH